MIQDIRDRTNTLKQSQGKLDEETLSVGAMLDKFSTEMDSVNTQLKGLRSNKTAATTQPAEPVEESIQKEQRAEEARPSVVDTEKLEKSLEKLLQGSLDALGDKISDRLLNMMKEFKGLAGPGREDKIKEIKAVADTELVDLSSLFMNVKVKSNIQEVGVDEREAKGIDKSLKKLRQMRKKKNK